MKVLPSHTGEVAAAQTRQAASTHPSATAASASFASVLAKQSTTAATTTTPGTDVATTTPAAISLNKGEAMKAVNGHSYAEIDGGKRDGLYVNTSNNKRRGQAFVLVHKHGREYHIYGTGKDRVVVALRKPAHADTQTTTPPTTTSNTASGTGGATPTVSAS
jgi:hypothetical protein